MLGSKEQKFKPLAVLLVAGVISCSGCRPNFSRDAVETAISPDGQVEATVYETNGGATTSFGYEVDLRKIGDNTGVDVAQLYGALRNEKAYGVNLKWVGQDKLQVEYLHAKSIVSFMPTATVNGRKIQITLDSGITDPTAQGGGMLHNLHQK